MFEAVLDDIPPIRMPSGRRPGKLHADKAYDHRRCRRHLRRRGIRPRIARRLIESSERLGRHRWTIERTGAWLGGFRRLRIRYERGSERFYALAMLACSVICDGNACSRHVVREAGTGRLAAAVVWPACRLRAGFRLVARRLDAATRRAGGPNVEKAIEVLKALIAELDDRYLTLLANRARKVEHGDGLPLHLVVVEELAFYTNGPDRKTAQAFSVLLRDFVARGRAAGMVTVATTQKPSADVVPTFLRDLFGFRWALRCSTPDASDTILGRGWASQGYSAAQVDPAARGVGLLLQEGGVPVRLRSCYLNDLDLPTWLAALRPYAITTGPIRRRCGCWTALDDRACSGRGAAARCSPGGDRAGRPRL
jgi:transposase